MKTVVKGCKYNLLSILAGLLVFALTGLTGSHYAYAAGGDIAISGPGVNGPGITVTQSQLRGEEDFNGALFEQRDIVYSTINTWPSKSWYRGKGVSINDLLTAAGGISEQATQIKFTSADGFETTFTRQGLLGETRYCYPNFMDSGLAGHLIGDASGAKQVDAIIAHQCFSSSDHSDILIEDNFSRNEANHLLFGQQTVTQQTNSRFAKHVIGIEVLTDPVPQWNAPTASIAAGEVLIGTEVELESETNDEDKVHYTVDGSNPTIESPMFNWIASRWWSSRTDELQEINCPIEIKDNTIIKAFVSGPGREDSEIATFEYTVPLTLNDESPPDAALNIPYTGHTFTAVGGLAPYSFAVASGSLPAGITLNGAELEGTPTQSGVFSFTLTVTDNAGSGSTRSIEFTLLVAAEPPVLAADISGNIAGNNIELTFDDEVLWRQAVTDVTVNGTSITGKYNIGAGVITINASAFSGSGDYAIAVKAAGYLDALVNQRIAGSGGGDPANEGDIILTISGDGVNSLRKYTRSQLEAMTQRQEVYSSINTWPSKRWYVGQGVSLGDLLNSAGMKGSARLVKVYSRDGYYMTFTVQELLKDKRYRFPNFKSGGGDADGHIPGSSSGAVLVEPILALLSAEGTDDPGYMNDNDALLLMLGQRAVTEQTGPLFTKYVDEIKVLTDSPETWDEPTADPSGGTVPAGTQVELHSPYDDDDKVYYTTDGSTPNLSSPIYNLVAKRWWSSRGEADLKEINKPVVLTKDTTIKAITVGAGRLNSDVAVFTYKVTGAAANASDKISPGGGGRVGLEKEASIDIPAEALTGIGPVEVKIEKVGAPPAAPSGFKILGSVYEFSIDGETSYSFSRPVTITLTFDAGGLAPGDIVTICYYDRKTGKWVDIGGKVSGNTVSVEVDHLTMFAVMAVGNPVATALIRPGEGGRVELAGEAGIEIPAGALAGLNPVEVKIEKADKPPAAPAGFRIVAGVYEFSVDGRSGYDFNKPATVRITFSAEKVGPKGSAAIYRYDENQGKWLNLGGQTSGDIIWVQVSHLSKFTVMAAGDAVQIALSDIAGHWAESNIKELISLGAVDGYPDKTFKPDHSISRAEFTSILVKAFSLEPRGGRDFSDTVGHWAGGVVSTAAHYGIVKGHGDNRFGPDEYVTREQMAQMVVNAAGLTPVMEEIQFKDQGDIAAWARTSLDTAVKNKIINGYPDNTVRPRANATRAEAVTIMVNALHGTGAALNNID